MALDVLSCPATTVDVEQSFSFGRDYVSNRRHRLNASSVTRGMAVAFYSKNVLAWTGYPQVAPVHLQSCTRVPAMAGARELQAAPFVFTGFQPLSTINGKNVALALSKSKHQSWWTRRANDCTWEAQRHLKKAVMLGGNNPALLASYTLAPQPNKHHHHNQSLSSSSTNNPLGHTANGTNPAYKLHLQPPSYYQTNLVDPAQRTIVIHPGLCTVLIGRVCDLVPI
ncbi:hypothetical protein PCANC_23014 [Puccinia coronata f. sp. avenae]|uniref:HAT C-terminal dimerisation domain-containing protein n=1 Tax=Puccinia coronata f. sp. avenae TaxID=200324 RepID=A0A2N5SH45_9BASI|nr:hypothetical protein PCANC_23014 [Puccinia coronata f. sp. avenae]